MAIIFDTTLNQGSGVVNSHNNQEVIFSSDLPGAQVRAEIEFNGSVYDIPAINGRFFFNFKLPFISLFNNFYNDNIEPEIVLGDVNSLLYDGSDIYNPESAIFTIYFDDGSTDDDFLVPRVLQSARDLQDFAKGINIFNLNFTALAFPLGVSSNHFAAVYFDGYPFDITLFSNVVNNVKTITHLQTSNSLDIEMPNFVSRLFFCDGNSDITINDYLPVLDNQINTYRFEGPVEFFNVFTFEIEKIQGGCSGVYLKWKSVSGQWTYWLFDDLNSEGYSGEATGQINRNFQRYENSGFFNEINRESNARIFAKTGFIRGRYRRLIASIVDSPRIYLYQGERYTRAELFNWIPVRLVTTNITNKPVKNEFEPIEIELELLRKDVLRL